MRQLPYPVEGRGGVDTPAYLYLSYQIFLLSRRKIDLIVLCRCYANKLTCPLPRLYNPLLMHLNVSIILEQLELLLLLQVFYLVVQ